MKSDWISLWLFILSLAGLSPALRAQAIYTADKSTRIQAGAGFLYLQPDYVNQSIQGISAWVDYDFWKFLGLEGEAHIGSMITPNDIAENSYLLGPRFSYRRRKLTAYGKVLIGRATITNQDFNLSSSYNAFAFGGGVEYKLLHRINLRPVDVEYQRWPDFLPHPLSPVAISIGASYVFF